MRQSKSDTITEYVFANGLASVMNKTKWQELAAQMTSNPDFNPKIRIRYLLDEAQYGFAHQDWEWIRYGDSKVIEWMEIDPINREYVGRLVSALQTDFSDWARQALLKCSIPFMEDGGIFRVNGYLRPNHIVNNEE